MPVTVKIIFKCILALSSCMIASHARRAQGGVILVLRSSGIQSAINTSARNASFETPSEQFLYEGRRHHCAGGPNIINVFSFSKA
jgi:hypothetical protein